jgi:hypothetical protein
VRQLQALQQASFIFALPEVVGRVVVGDQRVRSGVPVAVVDAVHDADEIRLRERSSSSRPMPYSLVWISRA